MLHVLCRFKGMVASFSSNSTAAQELAASVGMRPSSMLDPPGSAAEGDDESGIMDSAGLDPQLTGPGRRQHGSTAADDGGTSSSSSADGAPGDVSKQLPDPAEAARRILQELGRLQLAVDDLTEPACLLC